MICLKNNLFWKSQKTPLDIIKNQRVILFGPTFLLPGRTEWGIEHGNLQNQWSPSFTLPPGIQDRK